MEFFVKAANASNTSDYGLMVFTTIGQWESRFYAVSKDLTIIKTQNDAEMFAVLCAVRIARKLNTQVPITIFTNLDHPKTRFEGASAGKYQQIANALNVNFEIKHQLKTDHCRWPMMKAIVENFVATNFISDTRDDRFNIIQLNVKNYLT